MDLSAHGELLATGGADGKVRLWSLSGGTKRHGKHGIQEEPRTGRLIATLAGHTGTIRRVALSADGQVVASSSGDGTLRVWDTNSARQLATLSGGSGASWGVALSGDGHVVASGSEEGTIQLWEVSTGRALATFQGHTGTVRGLALSEDGKLLASGGFDGTVRLWDAQNGRFLRALWAENRYEHLDITGLTGITEAQRAALLALGAFERS